MLSFPADTRNRMNQSEGDAVTKAKLAKYGKKIYEKKLLFLVRVYLFVSSRKERSPTEGDVREDHCFVPKCNKSATMG